MLHCDADQEYGDDMNTAVYDKTDKGREEIATRKYHVAPRLRTLLVMIDGRLPLDALLKNFAGLGVTQDSIDELLTQDYITLVSGSTQAAAPAPAAPAHPRPASTPAARMAARRAAGAAEHEPAPAASTEAEQIPVVSEPVLRVVASIPAEAAAEEAPVATPQDEAEQFRHLYDFYNQTIKSTIGLRGIMLQLKVEKCATVADFRELRLQYLEAVLKAKGSEMAHSMRGRLDQLLGGKPERDDFNLPE